MVRKEYHSRDTLIYSPQGPQDIAKKQANEMFREFTLTKIQGICSWNDDKMWYAEILHDS